MTKNPQWARDLAAEVQRTARNSVESALPRVEIGIITKINPEIVVRPEGGLVTYDQQEVIWGVDRKGLSVGDNVLLTRDTSDNPIVSSVLNGNDPDPTRHVKGKALVKTVEALQQQSRFWKAPVATLSGLNRTTTDADGTVRLVLASDSLYRWKASTDTWVSISGGGGGGGAFSDLTGSLAASQVVDGTLPLSKLSVDPLARANHTGTQTQSTIVDLAADLALKAPITSPTFLVSAFAPTVTIGAGTNIATIGAVNTALASYLTTSTATSTYQPLDTELTTIAGLTATTDNIIQSKAGAWASRTPAQFKTDLVLVRADVGLGDVDNTTDAAKPVSTAAQTALALKFDKSGGVVTGRVEVVRASAGTAYAASLLADTDYRFYVHSDGWVGWGSGSASTDVHLSRPAPGVLSLDPGEYLRVYEDPVADEDVVNWWFLRSQLALKADLAETVSHAYLDYELSHKADFDHVHPNMNGQTISYQDSGTSVANIPVGAGSTTTLATFSIVGDGVNRIFYEGQIIHGPTAGNAGARWFDGADQIQDGAVIKTTGTSLSSLGGMLQPFTGTKTITLRFRTDVATDIYVNTVNRWWGRFTWAGPP